MMSRRRSSRAVLCAAAAATLVGGALAIPTAASAAAPYHCSAIFGATFDSGPDTGLSLGGRLSITVQASHRVSGELKPAGEPKPVKIAYGVVRKQRLLGLSFDLPSGQQVIVTGKSRFNFQGICSDLAEAGNTQGPRARDTGRWHAIWQ
ncbi:MAG: hypothetical protein JO372_19465 [Solirubrobacterales bacterium]|nr:hypothetical protein [Solirubrobacterales bacterium]